MATDLTPTMKQITALPMEDQVELMRQMWDHLADSGWQPTLTDAQKAEFDRRLSAADANPNDVLTWEQIVAHVRRPR